MQLNECYDDVVYVFSCYPPRTQHANNDAKKQKSIRETNNTADDSHVIPHFPES